MLGLHVEYDDEGDEEEDADLEHDGLFAVWPENWESVMLFAACWGQWHVVPIGMGGIWYEGLDHSKVRDTMAMMKVKNEAAALQDLRLMEAEAKIVRNRRANAK